MSYYKWKEKRVQNIYKKLFSNILLFTLADFVTKGTSFILLPLFTLFLTAEQYGEVDLLQVAIMIMIPFVSLSISESVLRYTIEKKYEANVIFTNAITINFIVLCIFLLSSLLINILWLRDSIYLSISIWIFLQILNTTCLYFIRAINRVKVFVGNSLLVGILIITFTYLFLGVLNLDVEGFVYANILTQIISLIYFVVVGNLKDYINLKQLSFEKQKEFIRYSLPLIPNSILWWLMASSSKYIILIFLTLSSNGLYAVATKMGSVLNLFNGIFFKAWQVVAFEENSVKNSGVAYTQTLKYYQQFLFLIATVLTISMESVFNLFIGEAFVNAWIYVPLLLIGGIFSSIASFLGTIYLVEKKTSKVFSSTLFAVIISIILNVIFIPWLGLFGAALANVIGFSILFLIRIVDVKRYIDLRYDFTNFILNLILIVYIYTILLAQVKYEFLHVSIVLLILCTLNRSFIYMVMKFLVKNVLKKRGKRG